MSQSQNTATKTLCWDCLSMQVGVSYIKTSPMKWLCPSCAEYERETAEWLRKNNLCQRTDFPHRPHTIQTQV